MSASVLILGLGSSGLAAARYCAARPERFGSITALDSADNARLRDRAEQLSEVGVTTALGVSEVVGSYDFCVASPGIAPHTPLHRGAVRASAEVISEIEFAFRESQNECVWAAVTGTNGKTTTTALLTHLLNAGGIPARSVGNIGTPAIEAVDQGVKGLVLVAEVSSFQLSGTVGFHPRVAVLLNITPDHVDWHGSVEAYTADKTKLFANLDGDDTAVIDSDDAGSRLVLETMGASHAQIVRVSRGDFGLGIAGIDEGRLVLPDGHDLLDAEGLLIRGPHNESNALAAAAAAQALGVRPDAIAAALRTFEPIEHRLEPAGVVGGVEWFNDSKATNPDAVSKALSSFGERPLVLLLGGRNKGNEFTDLAVQAAPIARAAVVFGEAREEIGSAFRAAGVATKSVEHLGDAVAVAGEIAQPGDAVLLSPACASFDEFDNYEQRGRVFKQLVADLALEEDTR